jgi:predicted metalloprotease with PDZ domain
MLNHEMMHEWTGGKIQNKAGELNYWFSEGFADYYAFKNRLRSKELSFDQWLQDFNNDVIKAHWETT